MNVEAWRARPLGFAKPGHRGKVTVSVHNSNTETTYTTRAKFNRRRIRADLGHFGGLALKFHKNPHYLIPPPRAAQKRAGVCSQAGISAVGHFRGVFRFRGEDGYVKARAHKIRVNMGRNGPLHCQGHEHGTELVARSGTTKFFAFDDTDLGATFLDASSKERVGPVQVHRMAFRGSPPDAGEFTFNSALTSARVAPGGPSFTGTAGFSSPANWTGNLAVSFAGEENVPLTGPGFRANLKHVVFGKRASRLSR
jgi:hypothetical protein